MASAVARAGPASPPVEEGARRLRLLIVEDSESDFRLVRLILQRAGWAVDATRAQDGASMRSALAMERWDLVIADYRLPRFSGIEALELAKQSGLDTPFILVSGSIGEDAAVAALHAGADDVINKSNLARLPPAVERSLAASEARRARRQAEAGLHESLDRLRALVDGSPLAIMALDRADNVTLWNAAAERMLGWSAAEVLERPLPALRAEDREGFELLRERLLRGEHVEQEARLCRADGRTVDVSVSASPLHDPQGGIAGIIAIAADIADRKRLEQERLELAQHTTTAVEEERARIARELHDDVGGTLTALRAEIDGLRRRKPGDAENGERLERLDRLVEAATRATVGISRAIRPPMLDSGLAPALEWQAREFAQRTGVACQLACNEAEPQLGAEQATALFRIFQEALTNVTKHARAQKVTAELFCGADAVTLEVRDDGVGLADGALGKRDSFGVRGMDERLRALGGWLDVSSAPGQGTTVMASLPRGPEARP